MPSYPEFAGRTVAITGAAQGIGAVTARSFAEQRARVALLDIDERGVRTLGDEITAAGGDVFVARTDVTDDQSAAEAIAGIVSAFGGLDVLVNCAGGYGRLA